MCWISPSDACCTVLNEQHHLVQQTEYRQSIREECIQMLACLSSEEHALDRVLSSDVAEIRLDVPPTKNGLVGPPVMPVGT